jgi:hypothetical protein
VNSSAELGMAGRSMCAPSRENVLWTAELKSSVLSSAAVSTDWRNADRSPGDLVNLTDMLLTHRLQRKKVVRICLTVALDTQRPSRHRVHARKTLHSHAE